MLHGNDQGERAAIFMAQRNTHPVILLAPGPALLIPLLVLVFIGRAMGGPAGDLVEAARIQIGKTVSYDARYQALDYPNGDIPMNRGVCSDVVIRAMRASFHLDLQKLVHEDMRSNFSYFTLMGISGSPSVARRSGMPRRAILQWTHT